MSLAGKFWKSNENKFTSFSIISARLKVNRSDQNCRAVTSRICFSILRTWKYSRLEFQFQVSSMYFQVVRIEEQIHPFVFWEKLQLDNFVSKYTDL